jgi:hypothetical protein
VHQLLGERDLAFDGGQVTVDVNAPPARVLVDFLSRPHRDRLALRASSSALTTSHRRRASAEYSRCSSSGIASGSMSAPCGPLRNARPGKSV